MNWDSGFDNTHIDDSNTHWDFRLGTTSAHTKPRFGTIQTKDIDDYCNLGFDNKVHTQSWTLRQQVWMTKLKSWHWNLDTQRMLR